MDLIKLACRNRPARLAHVVFRTSSDNYAPMVKFYENLLNAEIVHETPVLTFLRFDEEHHRIAIIQTPNTTYNPEGSDYVGMDHVAFTYSTLTSLAQNYLYLKRMDNPVRPVWCVNHGPTTSMYYRDPDGNKVELQVDNFESPEQGDAFMKGPMFEENPIGTDFDPEKWAEKILRRALPDGVEGLSAQEIASLKTRLEIGPRLALPAGF